MKHAYMIMAHCRPDLLQLLVDALDDERNDIYIHIDIKAGKEKWNVSAKCASIFFVERMNVIWGNYTQVECEYRLLKSAYKNGPYSYYHLMTGVTFPLKNQNELHAFFNEHEGIEFIGFDNKQDFSSRIKYKHFCINHGKRIGKIGRLMYKIENVYFMFQKILGIDLSRKYQLECRKGFTYWSITEDLVEYILKKESMVRDMLKYSISGDEIFVQTLVYNSNFRDRVYCMDDEYNSCLRVTPWENTLPNRGEHSFILEDLDFLLDCGKFYALKFDGEDGVELIENIRKARNI